MTVIVFLVAGMSSRFGGNPKQMAIVGPNNETLIEYSVNQALKANFSKRAVVVASDTYSKITDWGKSHAVFFGDGAGAIIIENNNLNERFNYDSVLYTDGSGLDIFKVPFGSSFELNAKAAFDKVVSAVPECVNELLKRNGMTVADIDVVVPHQPSIRLLKTLAQKSGIPIEKFMNSLLKNYESLPTV